MTPSSLLLAVSSTRVTAKHAQPQDGRTIFLACRGFGRPALLLSLAAAAVAPRPLTSQRRFQRVERKWVIIRGDVNHGPTGQLAELWRLRPSPGRSIGRPLRCGVFHIARHAAEALRPSRRLYVSSTRLGGFRARSIL